MPHNFDDCVKKLGKFFNKYTWQTNYLNVKIIHIKALIVVYFTKK